MNILIVDDDEIILKNLESFLLELGHNLTLCYNGKEAWERYCLMEMEFDVVITDIEMPKMDGIQLAKKIYDKNKNLKIVFISGNSANQKKCRIFRGYNYIFLSKPFRLSHIASFLIQ